MDLGSIFLLIATLLLVGLFVAQPLLTHKATLASEREHVLSALLAENERLLDALQELDFDYKLGKVPEEDYPGQRALLAAQWTEITKKLDLMQEPVRQPGKKSRQPEQPARQTVPERPGQAEPPRRISAPDDEIEAMIAARRRERKEVTGGFCAQCGAPIHKTDKFCSRCGNTLA